MKTEPDLIDIIAMLALIGLLQKPSKALKSKIDIAYEAYEQAQAMLDVRKDFIHRGGD
jgi:hypothetical protein